MTTTLTVGSLFAGIGGIELGLERTGGFETVWQCELDSFATRVLAKHWPNVRRWDDVRTFPPEPADEWRVDLICGGFPCQDISYAGKGAGLTGERSGLWYEYARVVRILRPRYVLVENVAALLTRGLDAVLGTLASLGYDAEWHCVPAAYVGAPHIRDRVFLCAYAKSGNERGDDRRQGQTFGYSGLRADVPDANGTQSARQREHGRTTLPVEEAVGSGCGSPPQDVPDTSLGRLQGCGQTIGHHGEASGDGRGKSARVRTGVDAIPDAISTGLGVVQCKRGNDGTQFAPAERMRDWREWWSVEPDVGRVAHGIPSRVDRLRCLGNAVVPQVAEFIGYRILDAERREVSDADHRD